MSIIFSATHFLRHKRSQVNQEIAMWMPVLRFGILIAMLCFSEKVQMHPIYMTPIGIPRKMLNIESIVLIGFMPSCNENISIACLKNLLIRRRDCWALFVDPPIKKFIGAEEKRDFAQWKRQQMCNVYHHIISELHKFFLCGEDNRYLFLRANKLWMYHDFRQWNVFMQMIVLCRNQCKIWKWDKTDSSNYHHCTSTHVFGRALSYWKC